MIKKILITSAILLSGCASSGSVYECSNQNNNYINESLIEPYNNEKTVFLDDTNIQYCVSSNQCSMLKNNTRWDKVEVYLKGGDTAFPKEKGFYAITRDYTFKNCISNYSNFSQNRFELNNKPFCLSAEKIDKVTANVTFHIEEKNVEKSDSTLTHKTVNIFVNNNLFIEHHSLILDKVGEHKTCEKNDQTTTILNKDFQN